MKKLLAIILVLTMCLVAFTACGATVEKENESDTSMFVEVEHSTYWYVVYHKDTKVMYVVSDGSYNRGTYTLLVNADGTPILWED